MRQINKMTIYIRIALLGVIVVSCIPNASAVIVYSNGHCVFGCNTGSPTGSGCPSPFHESSSGNRCTMYSYDPGITAAECNSAAATTCGGKTTILQSKTQVPLA
jgi:hypothetical protein